MAQAISTYIAQTLDSLDDKIVQQLTSSTNENVRALVIKPSNNCQPLSCLPT